MVVISVIVPVYNVSQYLRKCVDSIRQQTFKDLEIILVDDGSNDDSGIICDQYTKIDSRIKVIHKKNGGLSDARNAGLDVCQGEYIGFVDSDDYIAPNMYEVLYTQAKQENADVSECQKNIIYQDSQVVNYDAHTYNCLVLREKIKIIAHVFQNGVSVCDKIFKKEIFNELRFDVGKYSEDAFILMKWISKCNCLVVSKARLYYYIQRTDSITHLQKFNEHGFDAIEAFKDDLNVIKKEYPEAIPYGEARLWWAYRIVLERIFASENYKEYTLEVSRIQNILRKNMRRILHNPEISIKGKAAIVFATMNRRVYQWIRKKYDAAK